MTWSIVYSSWDADGYITHPVEPKPVTEEQRTRDWAWLSKTGWFQLVASKEVNIWYREDTFPQMVIYVRRREPAAK